MTIATTAAATAARTTSEAEAVTLANSCGGAPGNNSTRIHGCMHGAHDARASHRSHRADWLPFGTPRGSALGGSISGGPRAVWDPTRCMPCRRVSRSWPVAVAAFLNLSCCVAKYFGWSSNLDLSPARVFACVRPTLPAMPILCPNSGGCSHGTPSEPTTQPVLFRATVCPPVWVCVKRALEILFIWCLTCKPTGVKWSCGADSAQVLCYSHELVQLDSPVAIHVQLTYDSIKLLSGELQPHLAQRLDKFNRLDLS